MKRTLSLVLMLALVLSCCIGLQTTVLAAETTTFTLWTHAQFHVEWYQAMVEDWNALHPDRPIAIEATVMPKADMTSKLLIALQSGVGAPDMADMSYGAFGLFLRGECQLVPLNDVIAPYEGQFIQSRVDIYTYEGNNYAIDIHTGAGVTYYNHEYLEAAGWKASDIVTWDDYLQAAKDVLATVGKPMMAVEIYDSWQLQQMIASYGVDYIDKDGNPTLYTPELVKVCNIVQQMLKDGTAVLCPGGKVHAEEFYGFLNDGGVASMLMPIWYMGRFTDYCPDLSGKIEIAVDPVWEVGQPRSVGISGTAGTVTNQCQNIELAKEFMAYSHLSVEGNIKLWTVLGFDPLRPDVWEMDEVMNADTKFSRYFINNPFDILKEVSNEIASQLNGPNRADVIDNTTTNCYVRIFENMEDPETVLREEQANVEAVIASRE